MKGWFYCDAGYLKKCGELARLAEPGRFICAAARRNMKLLCNFSLRSSIQAEIIAQIKNSNLGLNIKQAFYALAIVVVACKCAAPEARQTPQPRKARPVCFLVRDCVFFMFFCRHLLADNDVLAVFVRLKETPKIKKKRQIYYPSLFRKIMFCACRQLADN